MRLPFHAAVFGLLLAAAPALADDKPKPNTLTPKEIADGWILLFDGETTFGWKIDGEAKVKDGALVLVGGAKEATSAWCATRFASYELQMEINGTGSVNMFADGSDYSAKLSNQDTIVRLSVSADPAKGSTVDDNTKVGPDGVANTTITVTTEGRPTQLRIDVPAGKTLTL